MNPRILKTVAVGGTLLIVQGLALLVYQQVERRNEIAPDTPFLFERMEKPFPAPELELKRPDGSRVRLTELRGRWVLVHFWATWCPPCREELPELLELNGLLLADTRLELLAVAVEEPWEVLRHYFGGEPSAGIVRDRTGNGHQRFGVSTLPDTFLVGPDGKVLLRFSGVREWRSKAARALLELEVGGQRTGR